MKSIDLVDNEVERSGGGSLRSSIRLRLRLLLLSNLNLQPLVPEPQPQPLPQLNLNLNPLASTSTYLKCLKKKKLWLRLLNRSLYLPI
jgi:hypothetical protein